MALLSELTGMLSTLASKLGPGAVDPYNKNDGIIYGKNYTPILTASTNLNAGLLTSAPCLVTRVGPNILVSGTIKAGSVLALNNTTSFYMSLPEPSALASTLDLAGSGGRTAPSLQGTAVVTIKGDPVNDRAQFTFNSTAAGLQDITFLFQYGII